MRRQHNTCEQTEDILSRWTPTTRFLQHSEMCDWKREQLLGGGGGGWWQAADSQISKEVFQKKSLQIWVERVKRGRKHVWCCYHESVVTKIRGETRVSFEESQTFRKKTCAHWLGLLHLVNIYCKRGKEISPFSSYSRSTVNRRQLHVGCVSFPLSCTTAANEEKQGSNQRTLVPWLVAPDPAGDSACSQDRKSGLSKEE